MDIIAHYERVIRQAGFIALQSLLIMNGCGAFLAWMSIPHVLADGPAMHTAAVLFLVGLLMAFTAVALIWLFAQIGLALGRVVTGPILSLLVFFPPALALVFFVIGFYVAISAFRGAL